MGLKLKNLAASQLTANIGAADIFITVANGDVFPVLEVVGDWFPVALVNDLAQTEFARVVERNGNSLKVERGQEGSIARAYSAGDVVELRLTLAALEELRDLGAVP